jgi:membrane fusion protein (multidrug efflux system)
MMSESAPALSDRLRKRRTPLIGAAVVFLVLLVAALWYHYSGRESTDDAQIDGHINPVSARVGGTVLKVTVADNQLVSAGTLLVQIDPRDYEVALARAEADLAEAEASAGAAKTNVPVTSAATETQSTTASSEADTERARLAEADARLREAQANEVKASNDLNRAKALIAKDEVSRQEYDAAVAAAAAAEAALESRRAAVTEAQKGVVSADARVLQARTGPQQVSMMKARAESAEAKVAQSRASVEQARLNLEYTSVKAAVDGVISRKTVEVGQIVQPGQPLLAIVPLEGFWVTANFKESQLKNMRVGQRAEITVDAYGGRTYRGHVDSIAAATGARFSLLPPENASGNYVKVVQRVPVKIVFEPGEDKERLLRPGMSVEPVVFTR